MKASTKAPPVYKPSAPTITAPPVYKPVQASNRGVQLKPASHFRMETRPAPPVYRTQQPGAAATQQKPQAVAQPQSQYELSPALWVGNGRQQIRVRVKGAPTPIGSGTPVKTLQPKLSPGVVQRTSTAPAKKTWADLVRPPEKPKPSSSSTPATQPPPTASPVATTTTPAASTADWEKVPVKKEVRKEKRQAKEDNEGTVYNYLERALIEYGKSHKRGTICAMCDTRMTGMVLGESGWDKGGTRDSDIINALLGASTTFDAERRKFGTACAEVHCMWQNQERKLSLTYSLAWDNEKNGGDGGYKKACDNCTKLLKSNGIKDLVA